MWRKYKKKKNTWLRCHRTVNSRMISEHINFFKMCFRMVHREQIEHTNFIGLDRKSKEMKCKCIGLLKNDDWAHVKILWNIEHKNRFHRNLVTTILWSKRLLWVTMERVYNQFSNIKRVKFPPIQRLMDSHDGTCLQPVLAYKGNILGMALNEKE
jgi:hypothetical protein